MSEKESFGLFDESVDDINNWKEEWKGMPECNNTDILPFKQLMINFKNKEDYEKFAALIKQTLTKKQNQFGSQNKKQFTIIQQGMQMNPKYPIYIISKGRWGKTFNSESFG